MNFKMAAPMNTMIPLLVRSNFKSCRRTYEYMTWSFMRQFMIKHKSGSCLNSAHHPAVRLYHKTYIANDKIEHVQSGTPGFENNKIVSQSADQERCLDRGIGLSTEEQYERLLMKADQPEDARILKIAIIGDPNVGKSTLINKLLRHKVLPISKKVHTTRRITTLVLTENNCQIIILDTPGVVHYSQKKKHSLETSLVVDPDQAAAEVDLVCLVVDVRDKYRRSQLSQNVMKLLTLHKDKPSVLVMNKVDKVKKKESLLQYVCALTSNALDGEEIPRQTRKTTEKSVVKSVLQKYKEKMKIKQDSETAGMLEQETSVKQWEAKEAYKIKSSDDKQWVEHVQQYKAIPDIEATGWKNFQRVFMVSALEDDGIDDLRDYLFAVAKPGDWEFHSSFVTDETPYALAKNIVWEKLLDHVEAPVYDVVPEIVVWEMKDYNFLHIKMNIICRNKYTLSEIYKQISTVRQNAQLELRNLLRVEIRLVLEVKTKRYK